MLTNSLKKNKERFLILLCSVLVLVMRLYYIPEMQGPFVFGDQAGYWGHAANLNGLHWQDVTSMWYSYGYSILLTPLYWIPHNMEVMYKIAIIFNAFVGLGGFYLGIVILRELEQEVDGCIRVLFSFVASSYSAYLFQSYIAWPETVVYTGILLVVWLMIRFCKRTTVFNMLLVTIALDVLYVMHNRNIVGIIAFVLVLLVMVVKGKINWKKLVIVLIAFSFLYIVDQVAREYFIALMCKGGKKLGNNDALSVMTRVTDIVGSKDGMWCLLQSILGKIWYVLTATFMLAYMAFVYICKKMISFYKLSIENTVKNSMEDKQYIYIYVMLLTLGTLAVTILATIPTVSSTRLDIYFYGRYSDGISGLMIMFGLLQLVNYRKYTYWEKLIGLGIYSLCAVMVYVSIYNIEVDEINSITIPGIYFFREVTVETIRNTSIIVILVYFLICLGQSILAKKRLFIKKFMIEFMSLCLVAVFWMIAVHDIQGCILPGQAWGGYYSNIYRVLNENSSYKVFYLPDRFNTRCVLRTRAVESEFEYGHLPDTDEENYFVIVSDEERADGIDVFNQEYYVVSHAEEVTLLCNGKGLVQQLREEGHNCQKILDYKVEEMASKVKITWKTEDMAMAEKILGKSVDSFENIMVKENEVQFAKQSNISLVDNVDSKVCKNFDLSMDILIECQENAEIINKWEGWLQEMTFALSWHQDDETYFFNLCDEDEQVMAISWPLSEMQKGKWNKLQISYKKGELSIKINDKFVETETFEDNMIYVSNQPVRIGNGFEGSIRNFKYTIY